MNKCVKCGTLTENEKICMLCEEVIEIRVEPLLEEIIVLLKDIKEAIH